MSSALETARIAIDDVVIAGWVDSNGNELTPIMWPNSINPVPPDDDAFIALDYLWGDSFIGTKNGRNVVVGVLSADIYVPAKSGTGLMYELADTWRDMLSRVTSGAVAFTVPSGPRRVPNEDSSHVRANVSTNFTVDETD